MTEQELNQEINDISLRLSQTGLDPAERQLLREDRKRLREQLRRDAALESWLSAMRGMEIVSELHNISVRMSETVDSPKIISLEEDRKILREELGEICGNEGGLHDGEDC
jgi:hypothetical protein